MRANVCDDPETPKTMYDIYMIVSRSNGLFFHRLIFLVSATPSLCWVSILLTKVNGYTCSLKSV